eukprot:3529293-Alexandrium_andersonii.AAC.1
MSRRGRSENKGGRGRGDALCATIRNRLLNLASLHSRVPTAQSAICPTPVSAAIRLNPQSGM